MSAKSILALVSLAGSLLISGVAIATPVNMDFDALASGARGEYVDNFYNGGCGTRLGPGQPTCGGPEYGVVWSNALVGEAPRGIPAPSASNIMVAGANGVAIMNVTAGFSDSLSFFYYTALRSSGSLALYSGLNGSGTRLALVTLPDTSTQCHNTPVLTGCWVQWEALFAGVAQSAVFSSNRNRMGFDDVSFTLAATSTPVPEPAAWGTFAGGLLLLGALMRRRRAVDLSPPA